MTGDQAKHRVVIIGSLSGGIFFAKGLRRRKDGNATAVGTTGGDGAPTLRPLSPIYVEEHHGDYVEILKAELTKTGTDVPLNIAVTGHYGSGKSSVLMETQRELAKTVNVINLSLPTLGVGDGRLPADENKSINTTNLIQKEIVKQLLYRQKPSDMPASRYSRLDTFDFWRSLPTAIGIGVAVVGVAILAQVPSKVREGLPTSAWNWINDHFWSNLATPIQWLSLLVVFGLAMLTTIWAQRLLEQRIRVTELAAGPTKVSLSDSSSSYFDEYLDEIVYFFQTSKTTVVIFEDLDRFKDPHIFETLRELNSLLNNAEQTGPTPIRFVYAIRDSIFEKLSLEPGNKKDVGKHERDGHETRRLKSTNRTKFFDLVVPMVPFISHRTSRDLIREELSVIPEDQRPKHAVIDVVGTHLTDMRLIKNICNEYEVFRRRILRTGGLEELTPDRLLASIVYKNLYLGDYEKIRHGKSPLDTLYDAYRSWVKEQTAMARTAVNSARTRFHKLDAIRPRSPALGTRLQAILLARHVPDVNTSAIEVTVAGRPFVWDDLQKPAFWRTYMNDQGLLSVRYQPGYQTDELAFDKVETLMGHSFDLEDWTNDERLEAISNLTVAEENLRTAPHVTMSAALQATDKLFQYNDVQCSVADVAHSLFDGADLVLELIRGGFIDENFALYVSQFPGQAISASAMNFIIKAVQPNVMDIEYHFGVGPEVDTNDIDAVLEAEAARLRDGQSVYNIELFDYVLATSPATLSDPIRRLASDAGTDTTFIDAYLTSGTSSEVLIEHLSASWPGIFNYLIGPTTDGLNEGLIDAALRGVSGILIYEVDAEKKRTLEQALPRLSVMKASQSEDQALAIAQTLRKLGIRIEALATVANPLRRELVKRNLYLVTLTNLRTILGRETSIALDNIKTLRKSDVYPHVLGHLASYLDALDEAKEVPTIEDPSQFVDVISDVAKVDVDAIEEVACRASADCALTNIHEVEEPLWPAFAGAHRLTLSAQNVVAYIVAHGVDSDLANWLRKTGSITVGATDPTPLEPLALSILNAEALSDEASLRIVGRLGLDPGSIAPEDLKRHARSMLPALVKKKIVADDESVFSILDNDEWAVKERLISASKAFPTYMDSLTPNAEDLRRIVIGKVPESIKDALLEKIDTFGVNLGPSGALALAQRADSGIGLTPTPEAIVTLATKGGARTVRPILKLLGKRAQTIDLELLKQALNALGHPYSQLTTPGRERPKPLAVEGLADVLARLRDERIVSSFRESGNKVFYVTKRYS